MKPETIARQFAKVDALKAKLRTAEAELDRDIALYAKAQGCSFLRTEAVRQEVCSDV